MRILSIWAWKTVWEITNVFTLGAKKAEKNAKYEVAKVLSIRLPAMVLQRMNFDQAFCFTKNPGFSG